MPKVLKPYTIIPSNLYVHRDADRQVRNIIKDMGRPGYVLVSRQMGKTNLLLNAKRELESTNDVFVYVDLSNPFASSKDCFENIIDTALESNIDRFKNIDLEIKERRNGLIDIPPHKQHLNELRLLLNSISGSLIIILDEIDALTKTSYSDQIFAQIRSMYFSRVNYSEINRLTYLLSGVIEPAEIIKDSKISPFNIGQKIFLNDFSKDEFTSFLIKSNLNVTDEISDRIYYWTSGNPRMTWDLCSEVENIIEKQPIDPSQIDKIVNDLYLTKFDKPPVDHIREIIKKDRELKSAIIDLVQNNGSGITDKLKNKLYLSGIINYEEKNIQIKNRIIGNSINIEWIKSLEIEEKGIVVTAIQSVINGEFAIGLQMFQDILKSGKIEIDQMANSFYYMSYASFKMGEYEKALEYIKEATFDKIDDSKSFYRCRSLKGLIHYYLNQIDESMIEFKSVIDSGRKDDIFLRALLNYGSISLKSKNNIYKDEASIIFKNIIDEKDFEKDKLNQSNIDELKSVAYYNLAQISVGNNEFEKAKEYFIESLKDSKEKARPTIILKILEFENDIQKRKDLISQIIDLINSDLVIPHEFDPENPLSFTFNNLREVLSFAYEIDNVNLFSQVKDKINLLGQKPYPNHLYDLAIFAINGKRYEIAINILNDLFKNKDESKYNLDKNIIYNSAKLLAYLNNDKKNLKRSIEYLSLFEKERIEKIDYFDFEIVATTIYQYTEKGNFKEALKYVNLINSLFNEVDPNLLINYLLIYHFELILYIFTRNPKQITKAQEIIDFANKPEFVHQHSKLLGDTGLDVIKQNAEKITMQLVSRVTPRIAGKTYGRNEIVKVRYNDGTIIERKFKKVESDINDGKCIIITN